jgi:hypothetical protein
MRPALPRPVYQGYRIGPKRPHPPRWGTFSKGEGTSISHRELSLLLWRSCHEVTDEVSFDVICDSPALWGGRATVLRVKRLGVELAQFNFGGGAAPFANYV